MGNVSRRDLLKTGLLAPAAVAVANGMGPMGLAMQASGETHEPLPAAQATPETSLPGAGRERLLLDFGWRFHFGNANDPAKDFGFGTGGSGISRRRATSCPPARLRSTTATGAPSICRTTGRSNCPSKTTRRLQAKASIRWDASIRRPAWAGIGASSSFQQRMRASASRIEFDGAYRETMVVFNGFYIGRHSGGYDPFSFDVTDFANPGGQKRSAGARGCHLERWLVLRGRGNLSPRVAGEDASGACEAVGNICCLPKCARARQRFRSAPRCRTTASTRRMRA